MNQEIVNWIVNEEDFLVPTIFKPVQFNILRKLSQNKKLGNNEKRYLRGRLKSKLLALEKLTKISLSINELKILLNNIGSYRITGLEALKYNGFGWFFETKIIEVINTKIQGKIVLNGKLIKFFRVKSIKNEEIIIDYESGLKYSSNEQILKDVVITKNFYVKSICTEMLNRYGEVFARNSKKIKNLFTEESINYSKYGV